MHPSQYSVVPTKHLRTLTYSALIGAGIVGFTLGRRKSIIRNTVLHTKN